MLVQAPVAKGSRALNLGLTPDTSVLLFTLALKKKETWTPSREGQTQLGERFQCEYLCHWTSALVRLKGVLRSMLCVLNTDKGAHSVTCPINATCLALC